MLTWAGHSGIWSMHQHAQQLTFEDTLHKLVYPGIFPFLWNLPCLLPKITLCLTQLNPTACRFNTKKFEASMLHPQCQGYRAISLPPLQPFRILLRSVPGHFATQVAWPVGQTSAVGATEMGATWPTKLVVAPPLWDTFSILKRVLSPQNKVE